MSRLLGETRIMNANYCNIVVWDAVATKDEALTISAHFLSLPQNPIRSHHIFHLSLSSPLLDV